VKKGAVKLSSASAINRCGLLFCDSILADSVISQVTAFFLKMKPRSLLGCVNKVLTM